MRKSIVWLALFICAFCAGPVFAQSKTKKEAVVPQEPSSDARRAEIGRQLKAGEKDKVLAALEDTIAAQGYGDLKEWAIQELYINAERTGKVDQVVESLKKKALKDPDNVPLRWAVADGYARQKDWQALSAHYETMLKDAPDDEAIKSRLIDVYVLAGDADKSVLMLEPIVDKNPGDIAHSDVLMNAYVKAGMKDKALALFKKRVQAAPGSPGLRGRYAQALQDFGMLKESLSEWKEAAKIDPSNAIFQRKVNEVTALINGGKKQ